MKENNLTGFIRSQEEDLTIHYFKWKYQKVNIELPPILELEKKASKILDDANRSVHKIL